MIYAKNADALDYRGIHPNLDLALEHITEEFFSSLGAERADLKEGEVWCTKFTYETIPDEESFFEAHEKFLDIHIMLSGSERVEIAPPRQSDVLPAGGGQRLLRLPRPGAVQADPQPRGLPGGVSWGRPQDQDAGRRTSHCDEGRFQNQDPLSFKVKE